VYIISHGARRKFISYLQVVWYEGQQTWSAAMVVIKLCHEGWFGDHSKLEQLLILPEVRFLCVPNPTACHIVGVVTSSAEKNFRHGLSELE
jgi:hypothetical protein